MSAMGIEEICALSGLAIAILGAIAGGIRKASSVEKTLGDVVKAISDGQSKLVDSDDLQKRLRELEHAQSQNALKIAGVEKDVAQRMLDGERHEREDRREFETVNKGLSDVKASINDLSENVARLEGTLRRSITPPSLRG